jgi:spore coat protein CotH
MRIVLSLCCVMCIAAEPVADVFGPTKVLRIELTLTADAWKNMEPKAKPKPPPPPVVRPAPAQPLVGPPAPPPPGGGGAGSLNIDFPYVSGVVKIDDHDIQNIGVRFKGNSSYLTSAAHAKRPFRLDFNHYEDNQNYRGYKGLSLSNDILDPSGIREALGYALCRAAGVPASRTAFAEVSLHVPGKFEHQLLGLYTAVEPVDKTFLKANFGESKGLLLKPERMRSIDYLGEDWPRYQDRFQPKRKATPAEQQRVIAFCKLVHQADDATFRAEIGKFLNVPSFINYMAANALVVNLDSFFGLSHNYYLYLHSKTHQFTFIPWDMDLSFGHMAMFGPVSAQSDFSINKPTVGANKLVERLLEMPGFRTQYLARVKHLLETIYSDAALKDLVAQTRTTVKPVLERQQQIGVKTSTGLFGLFMPPQQISLDEFLVARRESVAAQLAGTRPGTELRGGPRRPMP